MKKRLKNIFGILGEFENGRLQVESLGFFKALAVIILWQVFSIMSALISDGIYEIKKAYYMIPIAFFITISVSLILVFIIFRIYTLPKRTEVSKGIKSRKLVLLIILFTLGFRIFYVGTLEHIINRLPFPEFLEELFRMIEQDNIQLIDLILNSIFIAPIVEEVVCRGIIFNGLRRRYSEIWAVIISSFLFAFAHLNLQQGINAFFLGIFLAWIYAKTKSLYLCIALHAFNNFSAFALSPIIGEDEKGIVASIIFTAIGALIMYLGFKYFNKEKKKLDDIEDIEVIEF